MWEKLALDLNVGERGRTDCLCGSNSLLFENTTKNIRCYCFRCGRSEFKEKADFEIKVTRPTVNERISICLPEDYTLELPNNYQVFLLSKGIRIGLARKRKIGYSKRLDRLILPVYKGSELVWLQARDISGQRMKYLNPAGENAEVLEIRKDSTSTVVLVEDILSACKVGEVCNCIGLMGTALPTKRMSAILQYSKIIVMLDPDEAGQAATTKLVKKLRGYVDSVRAVRCSKDPKMLSYRKLTELIGG